MAIIINSEQDAAHSFQLQHIRRHDAQAQAERPGRAFQHGRQDDEHGGQNAEAAQGRLEKAQTTLHRVKGFAEGASHHRDEAGQGKLNGPPS